MEDHTLATPRKTRKRQGVRNPLAQDLRTPKYHKRVVRSRKVYDRKRLPRLPLSCTDGVTEGGLMFGKNF